MKDMQLTIVRIGAGLLGLIGLITGAKAIWGGASSILGDAATSLPAAALSTVDNELRFFAACWLIIGLALLVGAILPHKKPDLLQIGLEGVILGGLARLIAFTEFGPLPEFYPVIFIEVVIGGVLFVMFMIWRKSQPSGTSAA